MEKRVVNQITEQCRKALLGGIPIVYIKTDSELLIRGVIYNLEDPLVVPICMSSCEGYGLRPFKELIDAGGKWDENIILNIKNKLPDPRPPKYYPQAWYCKLPDDARERAEALSNLEYYVRCHEDPNCSTYDILQSSVVLIFSSVVSLTPALRPHVEIIEVPYPDEDEIRDIILTESGAPTALEGEYLNRLVTLFHGFDTEEIVSTMQKIVALVPLDDREKVEAQIRARKKQRMEGGVLEFVSDSGSIGGMAQFCRWLLEQKPALDNHVAYRQKIGTMPPKGVLLCGIPGCGKSESAKFTAATLKLPLLKLDVGSLMDKYVGASEQKMRDALRLAESMAPCVLWIDELEKGFGGAGGSSNDGGTFQRMFGYLLSWMQDVKVPVFIFATANNIGGLPKEFFRSGRFDALYAVYLPTVDECVSIFKSAMDRATRNIAETNHIDPEQVHLFEGDCFDDGQLAKLINSKLVRSNEMPRIVIGSDIQKIVNLALRSLVDKGRISGDAWFETLGKVLDDKQLSVYGDGEENVESIAIGYCRMLRKNFIPTANVVLIQSRDYVGSNLTAYEKLMRIDTAPMTEEELSEHEKKMREAKILQYREPKTDHAYDKAVYKCLYERINQVAPLLERYERNNMIR